MTAEVRCLSSMLIRRRLRASSRAASLGSRGFLQWFADNVMAIFESGATRVAAIRRAAKMPARRAR